LARQGCLKHCSWFLPHEMACCVSTGAASTARKHHGQGTPAGLRLLLRATSSEQCHHSTVQFSAWPLHPCCRHVSISAAHVGAPICYLWALIPNKRFLQNVGVNSRNVLQARFHEWMVGWGMEVEDGNSDEQQPGKRTAALVALGGSGALTASPCGNHQALPCSNACHMLHRARVHPTTVTGCQDCLCDHRLFSVLQNGLPVCDVIRQMMTAFMPVHHDEQVHTVMSAFMPVHHDEQVHTVMSAFMLAHTWPLPCRCIREDLGGAVGTFAADITWS
jgi:hypothetical protein